MGTARQLALERLGSLRSTRKSAETLERLRVYHERQVSKNSTGRLSRRRVDAFLGLCAGQDESSDTNMLTEELKELIVRWPALDAATSDAFSSGELQHLGRSVCNAIFNVNDVQSILKLTSFLFARIDFADVALKPELVILVGLLETSAQNAVKFTYSDFVLLTQALNDHINKAFVGVSEQGQSDGYVSETSTKAMVLELQNAAMLFVLRWIESTTADAFGVPCDDVWGDLTNPDVLSPEENKIDMVVLESVMSHADSQYNLCISSSITIISELVISRAIRAHCLATACIGSECEVTLSWIEALLSNLQELDDSVLGSAIVGCMLVLAIRYPSCSLKVVEYYKAIIADAPRPDEDCPSLASITAQKLLLLLERKFNKDSVISTLYGISNVIGANQAIEHTHPRLTSQSTASLVTSNSREAGFSNNAIEAICVFGTSCRDSQVATLALSILLQKLERVDGVLRNKIVSELGSIAIRSSTKDITRVINYYAKLEELDDSPELALAVKSSRLEISAFLKDRPSDLSAEYLESLLHYAANRAKVVVEPEGLLSVLVPLAAFLESDETTLPEYTSEMVQNFHNLWFSLVINEYTVGSKRLRPIVVPLQKIAQASPSLALETFTDSLDSDLESYPILKQPHVHDDTKALQAVLTSYLPGVNPKFGYAKVVYVNAIALLEYLKSISGVVSGSLAYYKDSSLSDSEVGPVVTAIAKVSVHAFLRSVGSNERVRLDEQLRDLLVGCCHQVGAVRKQAIALIDLIVDKLPSAFCSIVAISTLLETVTLLGWACYEEFTNKYSPTYEFKSGRVDLNIVVSDSFTDRNMNLKSAEKHARLWINQALLESAAEVRTLLTTYITGVEDHVSGAASDRGKLLAVELAMKSSARDQPSNQGSVRDSSDAFLGELTLRHLQLTVLTTVDEKSNGHAVTTTSLLERSEKRRFIPFSDLREKLCSYVARILKSETKQSRLLRQLVEIPFNIFTIPAIRLATSLWARVVTERREYQSDILAEVAICWARTVRARQGLFSSAFNAIDPFVTIMEYAPTDKHALEQSGKAAQASLQPHLNVIRFLSSRLVAAHATSKDGYQVLFRVIRSTLQAMKENRCSTHIFSRELKLRTLIIALRIKAVLSDIQAGYLAPRLSSLIYDAALSMFAGTPMWAFGSDMGQLRVDLQLCITFLDLMRTDRVTIDMAQKCSLTGILIEAEISRIEVWLDPLAANKANVIDPLKLQDLLAAGWKSNPAVVVNLARRFTHPKLHQAVRALLLKAPHEALQDSFAAHLLLGTKLPGDALRVLRYLLYWSPVVPLTATTYFLPAFESHPLILQYAMRSLESYPVSVTFFYVPQIVQALRHDDLGYVRRFIIETAKLSQLFAHQIIWNFDANAYKDEDATIPDAIKPALDEIKAAMLRNLSGDDKLFYETEFRFFGEVTSISGKLKPFIKKTKPEKKAKIDEEMAIIKVEKGVYLPSNPDGEVIDIDRKSGRPLQSHAKAPFMATFIIRKTKRTAPAIDNEMATNKEQEPSVYEKRQSAIFKVGDDCRQDVLALQLISTFRSIFNSVGLDLYVFPYRVTATAPGCGVIDVLPNSVSRDMLGREAVNGLYDYFITSFGKPESLQFQMARMNFIKSLAAYSVISYLLQFKDRHNGNIMYDDQGHVLHIDFGFCFDIAPGGITFESAPFKLTAEMVAVMGGNTETQSYKTFQELCIKAFLVSRQYAEQIINLVTLMLDSGLPCFKGQTTITNLRNRFHLDVTEQQAAQVMLHLIAQSHLNQRTVAYDVFQKMTNGIPY